MARGSKRKKTNDDASIAKKQRISSSDTPVRRDLLERCYASVTTLREHILSKLPGGSRLRRKKITSLGQGENLGETETRLSHLLDTSLVCIHKLQHDTQDARWEQWLSFSQKGDESYVSISNGISGCEFSQSEIVDFVIWLLFSRNTKAGRRPKHLLCDGFRRNGGPGNQGGTTIPGLFSLYPNSHVGALKEAPWPQLLALLGQSGEKMMIDLLLDYSIYTAVQAGFHNYHQLTGNPLSELDLPGSALSMGRVVEDGGRKPGDITLMRSRIFYAKPALTAKGLVQPGFKHIHVLNRCPHKSSAVNPRNVAETAQIESRQRLNTIKVMMYIFPRQFALHNVFTSQVDSLKTAQKFQDYTLREEEIASAFQQKPGEQNLRLPKLPKRLRGDAEHLVQRLQVLHGRCSYIELLRHYCPCVFDSPNRSRKRKIRREPALTLRTNHSQSIVMGTSKARNIGRRHMRRQYQSTQAVSLPQYKSLVDLATPITHVSAFSQAVLSKIIPDAFWGTGEMQSHNKAMIMRRVDHFLRLRRFETMSLHEVAQDLKINDISWLQNPSTQGQKPSKTDTAKRHEIFYEFLYYLFDSLLIPLIRSNFYVTESNTHRYQVFFFRHDVWKHIAEPSMASLKENMFEEVKVDQAVQRLEARRLGFAQIRLLPKGDKLRPITNLRRRTSARGKSKNLGPSINSILGPVHSLLKLEKGLNPSKLGSTMFSVSDIYSRLKVFKETLGTNPGRLCFAKVDVQGAFDTIPQAAVIKLMGSVPSQNKYTITKHAEVKPGERPMVVGPQASLKAIRRWHATAMVDRNSSHFSERLESDLAGKKKNTVFVDSAVQKTHSVQDLLALLSEHVEQNLVKVGKKYYRQKIGIPQGSVLSSFLCNYFYADLETRHLSFLSSPDCLLLRLIDDFLLITLDKSKAERFVKTMHMGLPDYGVQVSAKKTLVNFDMNFVGAPVQRVECDSGFPYCGTLINCQTLEISKDRQRDAGLDITTSLTVDFGRSPGQNFQRKVLNAFKIQSHLMFFDTAHNSTRTVLDSLHGAFCETASKMWAYIRCLPKPQQPSSDLIIRTITKVTDVAFLLLTGKSRMLRFPQYECKVRRAQVSLIACLAFTKVLTRKQTKFHLVMAWLREETERLSSGKQHGNRDIV
ncbi:Fc.00g063810.m01.CDS01 [Cosmosporella sp. VM-42]